MDPDATLAVVIMAALEGNVEELRDSADDLAEWLEKGGLRPSLGAVLDRYSDGLRESESV